MIYQQRGGSPTQVQKVLGQFQVRQPEELVRMQEHQRRLNPMRTSDGGGGVRHHDSRLYFEQILNIPIGKGSSKTVRSTTTRRTPRACETTDSI